MAEPAKKSDVVDGLLTQLTGQDRNEAIRSDKCLAPPMGCGGDAVDFRDEVSRREYAISGFCQQCQDGLDVFDEEEDEEERTPATDDEPNPFD